MRDENIKDKIRKLLALSESPYEAEAQSAMLKAQELMMKHRLSELDLGEKINQQIKEVVTEVYCTKRVDPWIVTLSGVIADNYRCEAFMKKRYGSHQRRIAFFGFEDDVEICEAIFYYAKDCIYAEIDRLRKRFKKEHGLNVGQLRPITDSYAKGFISGIQDKYEEQKSKHQEWGLVMVTPEEVRAMVENMAKVSMSCQTDHVQEAFDLGHDDGMEFDPSTKLKNSSKRDDLNLLDKKSE